METAEIYSKLTDLFRELFADDSIVLTPQTTADDIEGWDSFNHISVIVAVETRFGVKMSTATRVRLCWKPDSMRLKPPTASGISLGSRKRKSMSWV